MASSSSLIASTLSTLHFSSSSFSLFCCPFSISPNLLSLSSSFTPEKNLCNSIASYPISLITNPRTPSRLICSAAEYKFPDPIPEFAVAETEKFKKHLHGKLSKKLDLYGDSVEEVVGICTEIFSTFLHAEYGGPGTLLVMPFIDMADTLNERELPGGPQAARVAVKWAQKHVDNDWKEWNGNNS